MRSASLPALEAATALRDAGIPVLVLREAVDPAGHDPAGAGPNAVGSARGGGPAPRTMQVLIPGTRVRDAEGVLEPLSWRYSWVRGRLSGLAPRISCWWDGGHELEVYWGCPAAPLPPRALAALTAALWAGATPGPDGLLRPDAAARVVHLAVQACRPGRSHDADWSDLRWAAAAHDHRTAVERLARRVGVGRGVGGALDAARAGGPRPGRGPVYDGPTAIAWWLASAVQAHARPPRLRRLLAGTPALGDATIRARIRRTDVLAGPGVFVPTPDADLFVELAIDRLRDVARPVVVEVGTGCGAIALAIAAERPDAEVHGTELDRAAVAWARRNAGRLGLGNARFHRGSLLGPAPGSLRGRVDLLLANLPFYPASRYASIGSVPRGTIEGPGETGLGLVRQLARDAVPFLRPGGLLVLQMFAWQWEAFAHELTGLGYQPGAARTSGPFAICPAEVAAGDAPESPDAAAPA
jgi:release factor glutamine methyltransferase